MKCIVGAMQEEINEILNLVNGEIKSETIGMNTFHLCKHNNQDLVVFASGICKSNASASIMNLLNNFKNIELVVNVGLAGSANAEIKSGDLVIGKRSVYMDVDATAFGYKDGQVPKESQFFNHTDILNKEFLKLDNKYFNKHVVTLGTSDKFIHSHKQLSEYPIFKEEVIDTLDMETNAFAHILSKYNIPFVALRAISDSIYDSESSSEQFSENLHKYALRCKKELLRII